MSFIVTIHTMGFTERRKSHEHHKKWCFRKDEQDDHGACKVYDIACMVPLHFWVDVVDIVFYLINRGPQSELDGGITKEAWKGKKVNYSFPRTFGCEEFVHIDKENRTKIDAKSKKHTFIGYMIDDFGYRLWDYENHKTIRSRDVVFNENNMYKYQLQGKKEENEDIE